MFNEVSAVLLLALKVVSFVKKCNPELLNVVTELLYKAIVRTFLYALNPLILVTPVPNDNAVNVVGSTV